MSIALLAFAIASVPSTGSPSAAEAKRLAIIFYACADRFPPVADVDPGLIAATAWRESGFRPGAVRKPEDPKKPRMLGLMQLSERFLPMRLEASGRWRDPVENVDEFCAKLGRTWRHHSKHCVPGAHHVIAHHFAGFRITPRAFNTSLEVLRRRDELRRLMTPAEPPTVSIQ